MTKIQRHLVCAALTSAAMISCGPSEETTPGEPPATGSQPPTEVSSFPEVPNVLLRLTIAPNHTVTFFEPAAGALTVVERAPKDRRPLTYGQGDPLAIYRKIQPDRSVPPLLQAAYDRARMVAPASAAKPSAPGFHSSSGGQPASELLGNATRSEGDVSHSQHALTSSSDPAVFVNTNAGCEFAFCRIKWANGFLANGWGNSISCTVDHYSGNGITLGLSISGQPGGGFPIPVNTSDVFTFGSSFQLWEANVFGATGDSFHIGCRWN
jgi:hypothetical protein